MAMMDEKPVLLGDQDHIMKGTSVYDTATNEAVLQTFGDTYLFSHALQKEAPVRDILANKVVSRAPAWKDIISATHSHLKSLFITDSIVFQRFMVWT